MKAIQFLLFSISLSWMASPFVMGQNHHYRYSAIDVKSYSFEIDLNDTSDVIRVDASMKISFKKSLNYFILDLKNSDNEGIGMVIEK